LTIKVLKPSCEWEKVCCQKPIYKLEEGVVNETARTA
jgi:hypothetical protein